MTDPTPQTTPTRDEAVLTGWNYDLNKQPNGLHEVAFDGGLGICNVRICERYISGPTLIDGYPVPVKDYQYAYREEYGEGWRDVNTRHWRAYAWRHIVIPPMEPPASAPAPASGGVDAVPPMPETANRRPYDEGRLPGYLEGNRDWAAANNEAVGWLADNHAAIRSALSPAATPVSEAGGEAKGWAAVYDGQIKSCHRSRETCVADAEHYQAIHPVYLGPAWRHQED